MVKDSGTAQRNSIPISMIILGVESSCDETAAAVLTDGRLAPMSSTPKSTSPSLWRGGAELASRHHLQNIYPWCRRP